MQARAVWVTICLAACCLGASAGARAEDAAPGPTRTVVAEGTAPVLNGDAATARQAAIQQALREAVLRTVGVYVNASLRTRNYAVIEDRITTRTEGFAVLEEVVEEKQEGALYRVRARVAVRLRPLLRELGEAPPGRPPRALVAIWSSTLYGAVPIVARDAQATVAEILLEAGIEAPAGRAQGGSGINEVRRLSGAVPPEIAAWGRAQGADFVVIGELSTRVAPGISLPRDWVGVDYSRSTAALAARVVRCDTGEVVCDERYAGGGDGVTPKDAVSTGARQAALRAGRRVAEALLALPGVASRHVSLRVTGLSRISEAAWIEDTVAMAPGVRRVARRAYVGGSLHLDISLSASCAGELPAQLERQPALEGYRMVVTRTWGDQIEATVRPPTVEE